MKEYEVDHLKSIIDELENQGIYFSLNCDEEILWGNLIDIREVLDNKDFLQGIISSFHLQGIESISDYLDYLYLKKLTLLSEKVDAIKRDEDKQIILQISDLAKQQCDNIDTGAIIRFINKNYKNIFSEEFHKYSLPQVTISIIIPFQAGIEHEVFEHLANNYNYLLLQKFQDFQKRFENDPQLFEMLFHKKNLEEMQELRLDCVFPIFASIWNGKNTELKEVIKPIVERVISDVECRIDDLGSTESHELFIMERLFQQVYDFTKKIKHPKANKFRELSYQIEEKVSEELKTHGHSFKYTIPVGEIISDIKSVPYWHVKMLLLTHEMKQKKKNGTIAAISWLATASKGKQGIMDYVSSNNPSDDYFTHSHQSTLHRILSVGSATISAMWHDEELFPNCLGWYVYFLNFISNKIELSSNLGDDIELLYIMLQPVILSDDEDKRDLSPLCYGAGMFICALIEKLLRSVYIWLQKDHMYVPISSATIGSLLSPDNKDMENIFGRDHLMNLSFFLSTVGEKKIGLNIRNSLAHWTELDSRNLNSMMVVRLMYLYTDIINTLFWYFCDSETDELGEATCSCDS